MLADPIRRVARGILRAPRLSLAVVVCVALALTAAGAVISFIGPALLQPLPFPDADRLVRVWLSRPGESQRLELSYADVADLEGVRSLDRVEASARSRLVVQHEDGGHRVEGEAITSGYFDLLGLVPALGRFPDSDEHERGERVIVLSHAAWGARFGFAADIVGRAIPTSTGPWTVIGVAPRGFGGTVEEDSGDIEFWVPVHAYLSEAARTRREITAVWSIGRLRPSVTLTQAAAELREVSERIADTHPATRSEVGYRIEPFGENWRAPVRSGGVLLIAAAALLLLVATVNVAGLLLARALERRRELAVRLALGASRHRAAAVLVAEAVTLVILGGIAGTLLGPLLLDPFLRLLPAAIPVYVEPAPALYTLLAIGTVIVVAILASGAPAFLATRVDPMRIIREGGRGAVGDRHERRWGGALVVAEVAMTVVLAVCAGLLARSFAQLQNADLGFRTERVLRIAFFPNPLDAADAAAVRALTRRARDELAAIPGVETVARVTPTTPLLVAPDVSVRFDGMPADLATIGVPAGWYGVDEHFFDAADLTLLTGRTFDGSERPDGARHAVVSESLARHLGGAERAAGRVIRRDDVEYIVIGVVTDALFTGPRPNGADGTQLYTLFDQEPQRLVSFLLPTRGEPSEIVPAARRILGRIAPRSALDWVDPVDEALGAMYARDRFLAALVGAYSAAALALAAVGLFAVLAHLVARSRAELGLRLALGAAPARITADIVRRGVRLVGIGLLIGIPASFIATRIVRASLYGVGALDPLAWIGAAAVLLATGTVAAWLPARRAARTSPLEALRAQ